MTARTERTSSATGHAQATSERRTAGGAIDPQARKRAARERLIVLTRLLDSAVEVPGLRTRVGLDALLGLLPGVGDLISGALGLYLVAEARQLGASRWLQARMIGNLLIDTAVGAVPVAGDLFDVYFKAHVRNLKLLQKELGEPFIDRDIDSAMGGAPPFSKQPDVIDVTPIEPGSRQG
jgi:hypothetical protein